MTFHHILTIYMIVFSYLMGFSVWGFAIFFTNDINEIPLNLSRFGNEIESLKGFFTVSIFLTLNV